MNSDGKPELFMINTTKIWPESDEEVSIYHFENISSVDNPNYNYYLNNKTFINCINYIYKNDFLMFDYEMRNGNIDVQLLK